MRLERATFIIVACVILILLCVPLWRGLALSQLMGIPGQFRSRWTTNMKTSIPARHPESNAQLLKEHPKDFALRLALAEEQLRPTFSDVQSNKRADQTMRSLLRDFPKQPAVYELALNMPEYQRVSIPQRPEGLAILPQDRVGLWHDPGPPTKEQLDGCRRCIAMLNRVISVDPGNGWWHLQKAYFLLGLHRDNQAIQEIRLAANSPRFTDCKSTRLEAYNHLRTLRGGFDPETDAGFDFQMCFPYAPCALYNGRIAASLAYEKISRGQMHAGVGLALDLANAGFKTARGSVMEMPALMGSSMFRIGTAALDPSFEPKQTDDAEKRLDAYDRDSRRFLLGHGYVREAAVLAQQQHQMRGMYKSIESSLRSSYWDMDSIRRYPLVFRNAAVILSVLLIAAMFWALITLLTMKKKMSGLWDKRASLTSAFLCTLILGPLSVDLFRSLEEECLRQSLCGGWLPPDPIHVEPRSLLIPAAIMGLALVVGLVVMFWRTPMEGHNRSMPMISLAAIYLVSLGIMAYLHCELGIRGIPTDYGIRELAPRLSYLQVILLPTMTLVLYALLRSVQARFGRVRRSAPLTLLATLRYSSAITVAIMAVSYLCYMTFVAHFALRADHFARYVRQEEAAIVQRSFK